MEPKPPSTRGARAPRPQRADGISEDRLVGRARRDGEVGAAGDSAEDLFLPAFPTVPPEPAEETDPVLGALPPPRDVAPTEDELSPYAEPRRETLDRARGDRDTPRNGRFVEEDEPSVSLRRPPPPSLRGARRETETPLPRSVRGEVSRPLSTRGSQPPPPVSRRSDPGRGGLSEPIKPAIPAQVARDVTAGENEARVARLQMGVALAVGLVVAMSLYVWRRPRTELAPPTTDGIASAAGSASAPRDLGATPIAPGNPSAAAAAPAGKVAVSEARTIGCATGGRKLGEEGCERLPEVEKALAAAVQSAGTCLGSAKGGTIEYQVDVHFDSRKVAVLAPRAGRTVQASKAVTGCALAVKRAFGETAPWDAPNRKHDHLRLAIVASY